MAQDPSYPRYAQDFIMDTMFLSDAEANAYSKLEALCWIKEDLTIEDANKVHPLCEKMAKQFSQKFQIENGKIICKTHVETKIFRAQKKKNADKGGRPKKDNNQNNNQNNNQDDNLKQNLNTNQNNNQNNNPSNEIEIEVKIEKKIEVEIGKEVVGEKPKPEIEFQIDEVLKHFVDITGKKIEVEKEINRKFVRQRLKDKIPVDDLKKVIELMNFKWKDNVQFRQYIRIETLFNETKCNSYLTEVRDIEQNPKLAEQLILQKNETNSKNGKSNIETRREELLASLTKS